METLNKICNQLDCRIEDILEHIPDWKIDRSRTAKCSIFSTSVYLFGHNVFWNFQSLLIFPAIVAATIIDSKKSTHRPICILAIFYQFYFVCLYEISHLYLCYLTVFSSPQKSRKTVFLQPNPVCDFDPWFYDFGETVMITGSGLKKSYIFQFCIFFRFLMQWFWCFLYGFCSIFSGYGVFRLFSGCNFFVFFIFTVNNYILYANSTEISGFSVLLCFWRPSLLT